MQTTVRRVALVSSALVAAGILLFSATSCGSSEPSVDTRPAGEEGWLAGTPHDKFNTLADQLGGFDQTMIEVQYRYQQMYWAGRQDNWPYVLYQIEEMGGSLERGFQRRPARRASADLLVNVILPELKQAAEQHDHDLFFDRFDTLTANCNACHVMEEMPFIVIHKPSDDSSIIGRLVE